MSDERGQSLIEVVVAVAIVAIVLGCVLTASVSAAHRLAPDPGKAALDRAAARELRVAVDLLKYQGASIPPATLATTLPMPTGSPMPVTLSVSTQTAASGSITVTIEASAAAGTSTSSATIAARAPLPNSSVAGPSVNAPATLPDQ